MLILAGPDAAVLGRLDALAASAGHEREALGPLLVVHGTRAVLERFAVAAATALSIADATSTRALVLDAHPRQLDGASVLVPALQAPTLAALVTRESNARMLDALVAGVGAEVLFQPVIEIRSGRTTGFEALLRLEHDGRTVPPRDVFRAAAETGRLVEVDAAARHLAITSAAGWIGGRALFVNLVPESICSPADLEATDATVRVAGLDPQQVVFEATLPEDGDVRHLERVLSHLRARGYGIALDDVTADPAVLDLVERLRPGTVKVVRELVQGLPSLQARSAVANVVGAAHAGGATVVAKGIETAAQLDAVWVIGVEEAQGWQTGQPMQAPGRLSRALTPA